MNRARKTAELLSSDHIHTMAARRNFKKFSPTPDYLPNGPPRSPVRILGSGLSALTLAYCLHTKGIPFKIYTKDSRPQEASTPCRNDYSLLLTAETVMMLRNLFCVTRTAFRKEFMVPRTAPFPTDDTTNFSARIHRGRLERFLMKNFENEIEWNCEIKVEPIGSTNLIFPSHIKGFEGDITVDCMGAHSPIQCEGGFDDAIPLVVFRGIVELSKSSWDERFRDWFAGHKAQIRTDFGDVVMELVINDIHPETGKVSLSYIYSRAVTTGIDEESDYLWSLASARSVKDETESKRVIIVFLDEIKELQLQYDIPEPYKEIFDLERMKKEKIVFWLSRGKVASQPQLVNLWVGDAKILKLGDAAYSMGIAESTGAELAIQDGLDASNEIAKSGGKMLHSWLIKQWPHKYLAVSKSQQRLFER